MKSPPVPDLIRFVGFFLSLSLSLKVISPENEAIPETFTPVYESSMMSPIIASNQSG